MINVHCTYKQKTLENLSLWQELNSFAPLQTAFNLL